MTVGNSLKGVATPEKKQEIDHARRKKSAGVSLQTQEYISSVRESPLNEHEAEAQSLNERPRGDTNLDAGEQNHGSHVKRKRGRPKGSKNKRKRANFEKAQKPNAEKDEQRSRGKTKPATSKRSKSKKSNARNIRVVALGSGQEVGRSCILLTLNNFNILLDCGMHPGYNELNEKFPDFARLHELTNSSSHKTLTEVMRALDRKVAQFCLHFNWISLRVQCHHVLCVIIPPFSDMFALWY